MTHARDKNRNAKYVPVKDKNGNVIGRVQAWHFSKAEQAFHVDAVLNDGTNFKGHIPVSEIPIPLEDVDGSQA